eukprot:SAG22_NODE_7688_length_717_cov_0.893204_1_plen_177_part_10
MPAASRLLPHGRVQPASIEQVDAVAVLHIGSDDLRSIIDKHHTGEDPHLHGIEVGFEDPTDAHYWAGVINGAYADDDAAAVTSLESEIQQLEQALRAARDAAGRNAARQCAALFETADTGKTGSISHAMVRTVFSAGFGEGADGELGRAFAAAGPATNGGPVSRVDFLKKLLAATAG